MPTQHHAHDVMRAIETDRWAARATNTGYSAIVDPHGHTLWISEIDRYAIHAGTIYRRQNQTPICTLGRLVDTDLTQLYSADYRSDCLESSIKQTSKHGSISHILQA